MKRIFFFLSALALFSATVFAQSESELPSQFRGFRFTPGFGVGADTGAPQSISSGYLDLGLGKDISEQVFLGGGLQLEVPLVEDPTAYIGAFLENRVYFPSSSKVSFLVRNRLHALGQFEHEVFLIRLSVMPGVMLRLSPSADMLINAGHLMTIDTDNGAAWHGFAVTTTFDFHRKSESSARSRPDRPFHSSGLEIGGSVGGGIDKYYRLSDSSELEVFPLIGIFVGYRFNPHLSAGIEVSPGERLFHADEGESRQFTGQTHVVFGLNGRYRLSDKDFSPVGALSVSFASVDMNGYSNKAAIVLTPRLGLSWRLGSGNGYFELYAAPAMGVSSPYKFNGATKSHMHTLLRPEISLHYYHTLGIGSNWFNSVEF